MFSRRQPARTTVALCGAGVIAHVHAAAAAIVGAQVVAVASRSPERAAERASALGARPVSYAELPAGADVVVVCTPPGCHAADATAMLAAGAAVVLEKPLCRTLTEADGVVAAAESSGHRLLYAENLASAPAVVAMLSRLPQLGALTHLAARAISPPPRRGDFFTDAWGGGVLFDLGVHPLAWVMLGAVAAGAGAVQQVECTLEGGSDHGVDEHADVRLRHVSGLVSTVTASWRGGEPPVWDAQAASAVGVLRAELLPFVLLEHNGDAVPLPGGAEADQPDPLRDYGYAAQLRAFADDLAARRRPMMDARFGRAVLEVVCAAYASAGRGGEPVRLPFDGPRDLSPLELWRRGRSST